MRRALSSSRTHRGVVAGRFPGSDKAAAAGGVVKSGTALASTTMSPAGRLCAAMSPPATSVALPAASTKSARPGQATASREPRAGQRRLCGTRRMRPCPGTPGRGNPSWRSCETPVPKGLLDLPAVCARQRGTKQGSASAIGGGDLSRRYARVIADNGYAPCGSIRTRPSPIRAGRRS